MRKFVIVLLPLLLSACVDDSASYYADGAGNHALTIRRAQQHFWSDAATVDLIMSRLPDCQRRLRLATLPAGEVEIELFSSGDNNWTLRAGSQVWQVESQTCTQYADNKGEFGEPVGIFRTEAGKFSFQPALVTAPAAPAQGAEAAAPQ
ncbi:hypothetical protein ACFOLJ_10905 [Rugamonas sp. CCM 8940]|uniref:hypothetical protein n=1 Tax=Rugamonas sp. CCM 8940 TaxID=2765359 RepID=UPI0018F5179B|nr:hypothetical protein [Rugamonas sp. CCM 8940]MBJ7309742.1 hypothetical protein [Rugamonas sp. CCM 8940]